MKYSCIFKEIYQSQLGPLELLINSSNQLFAEENKKGVLVTADYEVVIKKIAPYFDWLPAGMQVESAQAWLFYLSKRNAGSERLSFSIALQATNTVVQCGAATGQNLIAVEFENGTCQMHIGTEDEDAMAYRASISDHMPARFETLLSKYEMEVTTITACGLFTQIPVLVMGEQFYFHYIVAENPCLQSTDYPNEADASTWFAVEQSKMQLERSWRVQS